MGKNVDLEAGLASPSDASARAEPQEPQGKPRKLRSSLSAAFLSYGYTISFKARAARL